jgi:hypothetical protein
MDKERLLKEQDEMRYRMEVGENFESLSLEASEIEAAVSRTDLICPYCENQPTTASRRTGNRLACYKCDNKRPALTKMGSSLAKLKIRMSKQNWCCAICENKFDNNIEETTATLDKRSELDHDNVRGALCNGCKALVRCSDDPRILKNATNYVIMNANAPEWWAGKDSYT